ncbi:hypothetical protein [Asticcacaulis benevestitus]|uniref:Uncharacterized protein n=1 Tax=Asticcacaulis benevestitus DSM 16100 = ATCC BAA-896 TaxID=1121022 RepID=V4P7A2_9CAUL|nr:hypothetical protein [Asticcacaulis benevestitus]ESQ83961.1 hypothetical protein ABENE_19775 [Asticcacaulis benevestitus DSM 16100 = ATCC BAA-896]
MRFSAHAGQVESRASAYWRQRVQPVEPVVRRAARDSDAWPDARQEPVHGPAVYVTLSPAAQAQLDHLRQSLAARR